ncbi:dihydroneopterin aldolase [Candidatus Paracaedibacter symbiosus]|uniref:dihydroneopterin aldolase n=1 Tax=Candidatus Paracaedibacter symbiosus TaxID=244582 RepID=UPI000509CE28|nr:dihydroneopterin aldolase [Candidatus Paracaedibacter symbiosus]
MTEVTRVPPSHSENREVENHNNVWVISVRELVLPCFIGVFDYEKQEKQPVQISIKCYARLLAPIDENFRYVCYNKLIKEIEAFVNKGHIELVESLAAEICRICFENSSVYRVWVSVEKLAVYPNVTSVGVEIDRYR